jgi:predicted HTH domain antitoxin
VNKKYLGVRLMNTIRMEFEMPSEILNYVSAKDSNYSDRVKGLMIYALVKEGKISFGKGAQMLGINKINFITDLGKLGIPYFDEDITEVESDLETLDKIMGD